VETELGWSSLQIGVAGPAATQLKMEGVASTMRNAGILNDLGRVRLPPWPPGELPNRKLSTLQYLTDACSDENP
jgi:hypothetical protein